jgi:hypothetical protein
MARRLVAFMIGILGLAITLWPPDEWKVPAAAMFVVLTVGLVALEWIDDRHEVKSLAIRDASIEGLHAKNSGLQTKVEQLGERLGDRIKELHADVVGKGSLKQRAKLLSLEMFEFFARRVPPVIVVYPENDGPVSTVSVPQLGSAAKRHVAKECVSVFGERISLIMTELHARGVHDDLLDDASRNYGAAYHLINTFSGRLDEIANTLSEQ